MPTTVFSTVALKCALEEIAPGLEQDVTFHFDTTAALKSRIAAGERFDLAILTPAAIEGLAHEGKLDPLSRLDLARCAVGLAVREGATHPDIGSTDAFVQTMRQAGSIAYAKEGLSGIYFIELLDRLGLAGEILPKVKGVGAADVVEMVAHGEAELGVQMISEIIGEDGVELVAPFPAELQRYTILAAATSPAADPSDSDRLLRHLKSNPARAVMTRRGLEPL